MQDLVDLLARIEAEPRPRHPARQLDDFEDAALGAEHAHYFAVEAVVEVAVRIRDALDQRAQVGEVVGGFEEGDGVEDGAPRLRDVFERVLVPEFQNLAVDLDDDGV